MASYVLDSKFIMRKAGLYGLVNTSKKPKRFIEAARLAETASLMTGQDGVAADDRSMAHA